MARWLLPREPRLALLRIRAQGFSRVLALEELLLQLALKGQAALDRQLPPALHRALDAPHRLRGLVRRAEAPRILHHPIPPRLPVLLWGPDVIDDAPLLRLLEGEQATVDHQ